MIIDAHTHLEVFQEEVAPEAEERSESLQLLI